MGQSHKRRRDQDKPLRELKAVVHGIVDSMCREFAREVPPAEQRALVAEVLRLTDPWTYDGIDAPIPAHRLDLVREWVVRRLAGEGEDKLDRDRMAMTMAPVPDW